MANVDRYVTSAAMLEKMKMRLPRNNVTLKIGLGALLSHHTKKTSAAAPMINIMIPDKAGRLEKP